MKKIFCLVLCAMALLAAGFTQAEQSLSKEEIREIIFDCEQLIHAYSYYRDNMMAEEYADLFIENGELSFTGSDEVTRGREAMLEYFELQQTNAIQQHVTTTRITPIDANNAVGKSYLMVIYESIPEDHEGGPIDANGFLVSGIYHDNFVKTDEGWKFARREMEVKFMRPSPEK